MTMTMSVAAVLMRVSMTAVVMGVSVTPVVIVVTVSVSSMSRVIPGVEVIGVLQKNVVRAVLGPEKINMKLHEVELSEPQLTRRRCADSVPVPVR